MATGQLPGVMNQLRRLAGQRNGSPLTDAQLLEAFLLRRDEASFEVLVWRHGTMVLQLCQRILRDSHEAEDAFQATFLVFACKAGSIGKRESIGSWLYKVAYRVALRVRARTAKRGVARELVEDVPAPEVADQLVWRDLWPILDEEIHRLPEKYRAPLVLCCLQSHTNEEAAAQLGCPKGTILSRLSRGRERLRGQLARRGVVLSAAGISLVLSQNATAMSPSLVSFTITAAIRFAAGNALAGLVSASVAALTEGVLYTMFLTKLKFAVAALVALIVLGPGIGWMAHRAWAENPTSVRQERAAQRIAETATAVRARTEDNASEITGGVVEVAKDEKGFTLQTPAKARGEEPTKTEIKLNDKTTILYQNVGPDGAKPTKGYSARVQLVADSKDTASRVTFHGSAGFLRGNPDHGGSVVAVGQDGKSITLEQRSRDRREDPPRTEIKLTDKTIVIYSNVAAGGAKAAEGFFASVWLKEDSKDVARKVLYRGTEQVEKRGDRAPDAIGKIVSVAKDGKAFTVEIPAPGRGEEAKKVEVKLTDKTAVVYHNVTEGGAKLVEGISARVWLADSSKDSAEKVVLQGLAKEYEPLVSGKLIAVSKEGKTITLEQPARSRTEEAKQLEFKLSDKTKIVYYNVGPGEAKPVEGYQVQVQLKDDSQDTAAGVIFYKPGEGRGR